MIINDFLMAIFFLFVGLEIKHELLYGKLSDFKKASFPIISAIGGVIVPALIFILFNHNTDFVKGVGIPISTDIAFAVGVFMMLKSKMNPNLKIFLLSLAVVDDLISILAIGILYSTEIHFKYIILASICILILLALNKIEVKKITPYLIVGFLLWMCIHHSGIHATISGVILAMAIPSKKVNNKDKSSLEELQHKLEPLCNLIILPLFALSNTAISLSLDIDFASVSTLATGVSLGLFLGKPLGIMLFSYIATKLNIAEKPEGTTWLSMIPVSMLAGIGFTMSIFVSEIAFASAPEVVSIAKISILSASVLSVISTYLVATYLNKKEVILEKNKMDSCITRVNN